MKKNLFILSMLTFGLHSFADYENYDGQTVSQDFNGMSMNYSSWKGASVYQSSFVGTQLKEADFSNATLASQTYTSSKNASDFSNADLTNAVFDNAIIFYAPYGYVIKLDGATIIGASFKNVEFVSTNAYAAAVSLAGMDLTNVNFEGAVFCNGRSSSITNFSNCVLKNTNFSNTILSNSAYNTYNISVDLSNLYFENVSFDNAILSSAASYAASSVSFAGSTFKNVSFRNAILSSIGGRLTESSYTSSVNLSGFNLSNADFSGAVLSTSSYSDYYPPTTWGSSVDFSGSVLSNAKFDRAILSASTYTGVNLSNADLTNASFAEAIFTSAVSLADANITKADFSYATGLTAAQLSQTQNYKDKDLSGIKFSGLDLNGWALRGYNLQNASFKEANITDVNARYADLRGADLTEAIGSDSVKTLNTIWNNGVIKNFTMELEEDSFSIGKYEPKKAGGALISAKLNTSSTISGGAVLTLNRGAEFEVVNNSTLTVSKYSGIVINTDLNSSTIFSIEDGSVFYFKNGAKFTINLEDFDWSEFNFETLKFSVMNWEDVSKIIGLEDLVKGQDIILNVNGAKYAYDWCYEINSTGMLVVLPEPSAYAAIFGALAVAFALYRRRK